MAKKKITKKAKSEKITQNQTYGIIAIIVIIITLAIIFSKGNIIPNNNIDDETILASVNQEEITAGNLEKSYTLFFLLSGYPEHGRVHSRILQGAAGY